MMRRVLIGIVSLAVTLGSFTAVTWLISRQRGPEPRHTPALTRATPQPVAAPPVARSQAAQDAASAETERSPEDFAAVQARVAEAAEQAEKAGRRAVTASAVEADEPLEVRLELYREALERALEASGDAAMLAHHGVWTEHFLRLEPVQAELAALTPGARQVALERIRRGMGFEDDDLAYLSERDARNEERWAVGLDYMDERHRLDVRYDGEAPEEELQRLRERHFGQAAETIALEEADGFYRFERPRIYGRN